MLKSSSLRGAAVRQRGGGGWGWGGALSPPPHVDETPGSRSKGTRPCSQVHRGEQGLGPRGPVLGAMSSRDIPVETKTRELKVAGG